MGATGSALHQRCVYNCVGSKYNACASKDVHDRWLADEFTKALQANDTGKIRDLVNVAPALKERELLFHGETTKMTALALILNRRDLTVLRELLDAGVSPNLPISEEQRSVYAHRSRLAALNGEDPDLQHLVPATHFEALCCAQHKELFMLLLSKGANPSSGIIQVCHCGDIEMLEASLSRGAEPDCWRHESTPLVTAVKTKMQAYEKVLALLRAAADPNFLGDADHLSTRRFYPALTLATRKRDYRMVRILLEAGADVNRTVGVEGLPNVLFWATYWGELELVKLFCTLSKHPLDLSVRKYTNETVFDVARTSQSFAATRKPRHIAKLPLPSRPALVYEKIVQMLDQYCALHPEAAGIGAPLGSATESTAATRLGIGDATSPNWTTARTAAADSVAGVATCSSAFATSSAASNALATVLPP
eukprot:TRINITY_DN64314_c0_g1_i1.p1 TRINITY_DN64314_c0_g1~~TRINITY_DN64314_c0_g1_i1.p1  ORF type:complete len:473 (+),score=71.66 TRINITY_DN64314_c0_g1_i1:155-1420(+)